MDLSDERLKRILLITFGVLILILVLINIMRYVNSLPGYIPTVYPTPVGQSQSQRQDVFPTLKPAEVRSELTEILNKRAILTDTEQESISSLSAELALHPYRGEEFQITYSPILNLFFIRKRSAAVEPALKDFFANPVLYRMYLNNDQYRLFVITRSSAEFARFAFERQYNEINSKLPQ